MINRRDIVVGLDIGNHSIKAALGEIDSAGALAVVELAEFPSLGIKKGNIVDIEQNALTIEKTLNELERLTGVEIMNATAGFSSVGLTAVRNNAVVAVGSSDLRIGQDEIQNALHSARSLALPADRTILQADTTRYRVDGFEGVSDPLGMIGNRLEAEVLLLIAPKAAVQNFQRSARRINLPIEHMVYNQILCAEAVLLPAEKDLGAVLIDMGGGTTAVSLFQQGVLWATSVLPVGGDNITRDLAVILKTSLEEAKRIKENYGLASPELAHRDIIVNVNNLQGTQVRQISELLIAEIISARVLETLEMIWCEIERLVDVDHLAGGVVFTGGGSLLAGLAELMQEYLAIPVRVGLPGNMANLRVEYERPQFSVALGAVKYSYQHREPAGFGTKSGVPSIIDRLSFWWKDLFA